MTFLIYLKTFIPTCFFEKKNDIKNIKFNDIKICTYISCYVHFFTMRFLNSKINFMSMCCKEYRVKNQLSAFAKICQRENFVPQIFKNYDAENV